MEQKEAAERALFVESIRKFKTTDGYKAILELVNQRKVDLLKQYLFGKLDTLEDHVKLRAEFMAQYGLLKSIDSEVTNYDTNIQQLLEMQKSQEEKRG